MSAPKIVHIDPRKLKPSPRNARKHSKKQKNQLVESIRVFGFNGIAVANAANELLAGHLRVEAAIECGLNSIPCLIVDHLTPAQEIAFQVADNQIALNATYDEARLAENFIEILQLEPGFDLNILGFEPLRIQDSIELGNPGTEASTPEEDDIPEVNERTPPVTQPGDVWLCGNHAVVQGDARRRETYEAVMGPDKAQAGLTDPPFNLSNSQIGGSGKAKHDISRWPPGRCGKLNLKRFCWKPF
jgi:hypothetical protein